MKVLTTVVARWLYGLPFVVFGLIHFMSGDKMAGMVPSFIPGGVFWIYLTGAGLVAAGVSLVSGKVAGPAALLLAVMLGIFVLTMHLPALGNPEMAQMTMPNLLKDVALAGAALHFSGIFFAKSHRAKSHHVKPRRAKKRR